MMVAAALLGAAAASPGRPNVIFTLVDDWGYNDVGYHNAENEGVIRTPNMDRLSSSAHGIRLERFYSQPICTPTRSQTLTGRYQIHTGLQHGVLVRPSPCCCPCMLELLVIVRVRGQWMGQENGLPLNETTAAEHLRKLGFTTHAIGKWCGSPCSAQPRSNPPARKRSPRAGPCGSGTWALPT